MATPAARSGPKSSSGVLAGLIGALIGGGAMFVVMVLYRQQVKVMFADTSLATVAALGIVAAVLAITAHELGHLAGGMLAGFRFQMLSVGPARLERGETGALRVRLNSDLASWGGLAVMTPTGTRGLGRRMVVLVAAGPAASVVLGAAGMWAGVALETGPAALFAAAFGTWSLLLAVVTMLPVRNGAYPNDGLRLVTLATGGPAADVNVATLAVVAVSRAGVRPRDWEPALAAGLRRAREGSVEGTPEETAARLLLYLWELDRGEVAPARAELDRARELADAAPVELRALVRAEDLYIEATHGTDAGRLAATHRAGEKLLPLATASTRLSALAAWAIRTGDIDSARRHLEDMKRLPDVQTGMMRDRLLELEERLEGATEGVGRG